MTRKPNVKPERKGLVRRYPNVLLLGKLKPGETPTEANAELVEDASRRGFLD
jgi:hypothetical protein